MSRPFPQVTIAIIGGGLAGLSAARCLVQADVDTLVIEARERLGGRILTVDATGALATDGFDLGPSWFWPHAQPDVAALVEALGLAHVPQHSDGDVIFERMSRESAWRYRATEQVPQSMRLVGGTGALVRALADTVPSDRLVTGRRVAALELVDAGIRLTTVDADGTRVIVQARHVLAAVPPRLLAGLPFTPALDTGTLDRWKATATWMAPHAKFFAVYDRPFWREAGLCGTAQSFVGPMGEVHDATTASGHAALFGFIGLNADMRAALGDTALTAACVGQLARLFGEEASRPSATLLKDWAADPLTATAADGTPGGHPQPSDSQWISRVWADRLSLCASETSAVEPGFMAGAIYAGQQAARDVLARLGTSGLR